MAREEEKLKLGKGAAFVKGRLKRLRQEDETWEADFQGAAQADHAERDALPGHGRRDPDGSFLADSHVEGRPTVNDMATLLAHAMRRPLTGKRTGPGASTSGATRSGESYSRTWRNSASRSPSSGSFPRCSKPTRATCGRCEKPTGLAWSSRPQSRRRREAVPGHRPMGPGLRPHRDRRPGDVRLRRAGRWTTAGWSSRTTSPTRWPRRWRLWRRG